MKKLLLILLSCIMAFSMFACGDSETKTDSDEDEEKEESTTQTDTNASDSTSPESRPENTTSDNGDDFEELPEETLEKLPEYIFRADEAGYFDAYRYGSFGNYDVIVDTYGEFVYSFSEEESLSIYANGYFISTENNVCYLKSAKGDVIASSEELGATRFGLTGNYINHERFLADGYVFVYKINESYTGNSYEIGILKTDGTWIVPMSDDHPLLSCGWEFDLDNLKYVGGGCILVDLLGCDHDFATDNIIYNIHTNEIYDYDISDGGYQHEYMIATIDFNSEGVSYGDYGEKIWEFRTDGTGKTYDFLPDSVDAFEKYGFHVDEDGTIYSMINDGWNVLLVDNRNNIIKNFNDNNIDICSAAYCGEGNWLVAIESDDDTYYYSIINTDGEFLFEPVKTDMKKIMLDSGTLVEIDGSGYTAVIDIDGNVLYESEGYNTEITINNGVVCEDGTEEIYTLIN